MGKRGSEIDVSKVQLCMAITKVGKVPKVGKVLYFRTTKPRIPYSSGMT